MLIELQSGESLTTFLPAEPILTLRDYLENFENIENSKVERKAFEKRHSISSYDIFGIPITGEEVREAMSGRERLGCVLGGSTLGLFIGSLFGWSNAVEYVGQEHGECLAGNIYQVNQPQFLAYSVASGGAGAGIGYYTGTKWDFIEAKDRTKMRGFAYFSTDTIISEQEVRMSLISNKQNPCLLIGIPVSLLTGFAAMMFAYFAGREIQGIERFDRVIGEEVSSVIAVTIGIGTAATLIDNFIKIGNERNRKEAIKRIKEEKAKLLKNR